MKPARQNDATPRFRITTIDAAWLAAILFGALSSLKLTAALWGPEPDIGHSLLVRAGDVHQTGHPPRSPIRDPVLPSTPQSSWTR